MIYPFMFAKVYDYAVTFEDDTKHDVFFDISIFTNVNEMPELIEDSDNDYEDFEDFEDERPVEFQLLIEEAAQDYLIELEKYKRFETLNNNNFSDKLLHEAENYEDSEAADSNIFSLADSDDTVMTDHSLIAPADFFFNEAWEELEFVEDFNDQAMRELHFNDGIYFSDWESDYTDDLDMEAWYRSNDKNS